MESSSLPLLAVGSFDSTTRSTLELAASEAAFPLEWADSAREALTILTANPHAGLLVHDGELSASGVLRGDPRLPTLPMLALSRDSGELGFASAFAAGADDVVPMGRARSLISRLRALPRTAIPLASGGRGVALVADAEQSRRVVLGRVLRNAGYSVTFATSARDAWEYGLDKSLALVVLSSDLDDAPRGLVERARTAGVTATFIVTCPPRELRAQRKNLEGLTRVTATDAYAPVENVLFLANELSGRTGANQRGSARVLYGTSIAFRGAGREEDETGYTFNVSASGLYVRSLVLPDDDSVWLELRPPRSERRVRLVGRVAWRRRFGSSERATVPAGFGVEIVDGAAADRTAWLDGYAAFAESVG
jgi:CheY-like chemotaxis protein